MILSYISPVLMECLYDFVVHINKLVAILKPHKRQLNLEKNDWKLERYLQI